MSGTAAGEGAAGWAAREKTKGLHGSRRSMDSSELGTTRLVRMLSDVGVGCDGERKMGRKGR